MNAKRHLRETIHDLEGLGMTVEVLRKKRHYCLLVSQNNVTGRVFVGKTPSDHRARLNIISDAKKVLRREG